MRGTGSKVFNVNGLKGWGGGSTGFSQARTRLMRRRLNHGRKNSSRARMVREFSDEFLHGRMPESVEAEEVHFLHGLFGCPLLYSHAIGGDKYSSAVVPEAAMHENLLFRIVPKQFQELRYLLIARGCPAAYRNVHEAHS